MTKKSQMSYRVNVVFIKDNNGYYAHCPELPGCHSQGDTYEEARTNIREALELYLDTMSKDEIAESLNKELLTTTMEVEIG
jgi:predicted RNase H-like HicB family nuclease